MDTQRRRLPPWFKVRARTEPEYLRLKRVMRDLRLHTVCEEARCPNIWDCWNRGTATFMILGETCTRSCGFCAVTTGRPTELDLAEPGRVARAVSQLGLRHVVVTSVNRDELADGGAGVFASTILAIREEAHGCAVEVLIPDFQGSTEALRLVCEAKPDILNHNVETVPRLYPQVRPQAKYPRSLAVLQQAKAAGLVSKTGVMVGLGEERGELEQVMADLVRVGCDILTIGQYLQPTPTHLPVARYYHPDEFAELQACGEALGLRRVFAGPLVRSSFHADEQARSL